MSGPELSVNAPGTVSEGDQISGSVFIVAGDTGDGDTWRTFVKDETTGNAAYVDYTIGGLNQAFTQAITGILEVQGLKSCAGLPSSESFFLYQLVQEPTGADGWNGYLSVMNNVTYTLYNTPEYERGPDCHYSGGETQGSEYNTITTTWTQ